MNPDEKERYIGEIVRYILLSETSKTYAVRADISKVVLQPHGVSKMSAGLVPLATEKLRRVFGWETPSVPKFTEKGKLEHNEKTKLMTRLSPQLEEFMAPIRDELPTPPDLSFLMMVLSLILMHNFDIEQSRVWKELVAFGIHEDVPHSSFGGKKPSDMVKDLIKQHYLVSHRTVEGGVTVHNINIGSRSLLEIGKVNILRFINSICKTSVDPSALKEFTDEQSEYLPHFAFGEDLPTLTEPPAATEAVEEPEVETIEEEEAPTPQRGGRAGARQANGHAEAEATPSQTQRRGKRARA